MPSELPVIRSRTNEDNVEKMKLIAKCNKRSLSKEVELIVEQYIREFEEEYGVLF